MSLKQTDYFQNCLGVFQGGGCKAIAFVGAYEEAVKRGVFFSEIAGTSAGSIVAVLIGAGATPKQLNEIIERLDFKKFMGDPIPDKDIKCSKFISAIKVANGIEKVKQFTNYMRYLGMYNSGYIAKWINEELQKLLNKPGETIKFIDLLIPTTVVSTDLKVQNVKIWNGIETPTTEIGIAVQTSCSIPFYFQPYNKRYVDGGMVSNLPAYLLKPESILNKVLAFGFKKSLIYPDIDNGFDLFQRVIFTAIDGATDIQLQLQDHVTLIEIDPGTIESTDFEKIDVKVRELLINNGRKATIDFFNKEGQNLKKHVRNEDICGDITETFNLLIKGSLYPRKEILIADEKATWLYSLFPLLLKWKKDNSEVKVLLKKNGETQEHRDYKIRLLNSLGFTAIEIDELPFSGFVMDGDKPSGCAVIINEIQELELFSKYYSCEEDLLFVKRLQSDFKKFSLPNILNQGPITLVEVNEAIIKNKLKSIKQYALSDVEITLEEVSIDKIVFLTKYLKGYKYRLVESLFKLYDEHKIIPFKPAVIKFNNQKESIVTPPVVEKHGDEYVIIEGNARFVYAEKNGLNKLYAAVVVGVKDRLPSDKTYTIKQVLISDIDKAGKQRYEGFDRNLFRRIEETVRAPKDSLND